MQLTVSASVVLGIIIVVRLLRPTQPRTRFDEKMSAVSCIVFGVLIAATPWGQAILQLVGTATHATH